MVGQKLASCFEAMLDQRDDLLAGARPVKTDG